MTKILDVTIESLSLRQAMNRIASFLKGNKLSQIVTVNPEFVLEAQKDSEFKRIINSADLSVPDGFGLKIAAFLTNQKIKNIITGVDLTWEIAKMAEKRGYSIFLLGGGRDVAFKASRKMKFIYPKLKIAGFYAGSPTEKGIITRINKSGADILLVAFGAPKQDKFIYKNRHRLKVKVAMGVGGTFDYIAGIVPRAPLWMRRAGFEWLYRLIRQPWRISRIFHAVVIFPLTVLFSRS